MAVKTRKNNNQLLQITKYLVENYKILSLVKLQKILYFLDLEYLKKYNEPLFDEEFEAWIYGPTLTKVFSYIRNNGFNFSELEKEYYLEIITPLSNQKIIFFIDQTIQKYLDFTPERLVEISYNTAPWINARKDLLATETSTEKISLKDMKKYAKSHNFDW